VFAVFERRIEFEAGEEGRGGWLHVFADSLYRLVVDGRVVGYGPARFARCAPQFDTWRLGPGGGGSGGHVIEIEVNSRGAGCYQAEPGGRAGLAVWGAYETSRRVVDLSLPEGWLVFPDASRDPLAEPFSFAQGPVEIRDLGAGRQPGREPVVCRAGEGLGPLVPRAIPLPALEEVEPVRLVMAAPLQDRHFRAGFRSSPEAPAHGRLAFFTHIHSPCAQRVQAGVFWGPLALNGRRLEHARCALRGNRENTLLDLREGWNFLVGMPEVLAPCWPWMIELPGGCGLTLRAMPDGDPSLLFAVREPVSATARGEFVEAQWQPPDSPASIPGFPEGWEFRDGRERVPSPAREMAWDIPAEPVEGSGVVRWPVDVPVGPGLEGTAVFDFGGEYLGHAFLDVEAPAGAVLDLGYDERLTPRGDIDFFKTNPFTNTADRFILPGGRVRFEAFHERGGRFLQATVRGGPAKIHRVGVRRTTSDYPAPGSFACGDEVLDWAWEAGVRTLQASMADGWIDPWRERGLYLGDAFVEAQATSKFTPDLRLETWCLRLWARTQMADGQMPDVTPSCHGIALNDYTL
ncbi:MAG: family 78 glycoside hydrolase catalytic domain, partial [Terrimicrobiaceae bacterium]|nr:family 78 glycoside hydrolase catalytic domain [Terrimicrobiaceae bacterium]